MKGYIMAWYNIRKDEIKKSRVKETKKKKKVLKDKDLITTQLER